ncbi:MAG: Fic family protein [Thermoleophilaceae bacterium]
MTPANTRDLPELFVPDDAKWASRAAARGEIRRLARRLYSTNLDEPAEQLLRRRWPDVAALYFPGAAIVDRSAMLAAPAADGSLFLDTGPTPARPRPIELPGLALRPRAGPGPIDGDMPFAQLWMSSRARAFLDNLRPSRARSAVRRTLRRDEIEERLDEIARVQGDAALDELRDAARAVAPQLDAMPQLAQLDALIGDLQGSRDAPLSTRVGRARRAGMGYDTEQLRRFELLRAELAQRELPARPAPADPAHQLAFFEAYFSNWIEGTEFEVAEAEQIVFAGRVPPQRPADAHDIQGTFDAITDPRLRDAAPRDADELEAAIQEMHRRIMGGRPEVRPGAYKEVPNRAGSTAFVHPDLVRGTLREGFALYDTLPAGMARAVYGMFLVAEVHPFADGNGRVARALMNAEMTGAGLCRVVIPLPYRDDHLRALRALTRNDDPRPLRRTIDRAQRWAALMPWDDRASVLEAMRATHALVDPREDEDVRLLDPPAR